MKRLSENVFNGVVNEFGKFVELEASPKVFRGEFLGGSFDSVPASANVGMNDSLYGCLEVQDGGDSDGYLSLCDGYVRLSLDFDPVVNNEICVIPLKNHMIDNELSSEDVCRECNELIDKDRDNSRILRECYKYNDYNLKDKFASSDELIEWYESGEDNRDDITQDELNEAIMQEWQEMPSFLNVCVRFNVNPYSRKITATITTSYNNDYVYDRAGDDHYVYVKNVSFENSKLLLNGIGEFIGEAFSCINIKKI